MYNRYKNSVRYDIAPGQDSLVVDPVLIPRPTLTLYKEEYTKVKCQISRNALLLSAVGALSWSISLGSPSL